MAVISYRVIGIEKRDDGSGSLALDVFALADGVEIPAMHQTFIIPFSAFSAATNAQQYGAVVRAAIAATPGWGKAEIEARVAANNSSATAISAMLAKVTLPVTLTA